MATSSIWTTNKDDIFIGPNEREDYLIDGLGGNDTLGGNAGNDTIYGGDGKDSINGFGGADVLAGGKGNDTLTGGDGSDVFVWNKGDGNDLITDYAEEDLISISSGIVESIVTNKAGNAILTIGKNKITLTGGKGKIITYADDNGIHTETVKFTSKSAILRSSYDKDSFDINEYKDGNYNTSVVTIDASAVEQDIAITGNAKANKITGSAYEDTIYGGRGNDTLTGGEGSDVFVWNKGDGNDVITDYNMEDIISIASGTLSEDFRLNGNDVIATVSGKTITVKDGKNKYIHFVDASGNDIWYQKPDPFPPIKFKTVTIPETYKEDTFDVNEIYGASKNIKKIDASKVFHALEITGNKYANLIIGTSEDDYIKGGAGKDTIRGGSGDDTLEGGKGNDTLWGGKGNDKLWGDAGNDKFIYHSGEGKDVILGFENKDTLTLDNLNFTSSYNKSKGELVLKIGSGSVTFKDFSATTFHINNDTYKISGSKLKLGN